MLNGLRALFKRQKPCAETDADICRYEAQAADVRQNLDWLEQQVALITRDVTLLAPRPEPRVPPLPPRPPRKWRRP